MNLLSDLLVNKSEDGSRHNPCQKQKTQTFLKVSQNDKRFKKLKSLLSVTDIRNIKKTVIYQYQWTHSEHSLNGGVHSMESSMFPRWYVFPVTTGT